MLGKIIVQLDNIGYFYTRFLQCTVDKSTVVLAADITVCTEGAFAYVIVMQIVVVCYEIILKSIETSFLANFSYFKNKSRLVRLP
jgi:hypothetical protein